jgi:hypothetical protein
MRGISTAGLRAWVRNWGFASIRVGDTTEVLQRQRDGRVETTWLPVDIEDRTPEHRYALLVRIAVDHGEEVPEPD